MFDAHYIIFFQETQAEDGRTKSSLIQAKSEELPLTTQNHHH